MDRTMGLRLRVAWRITAGLIVSSIGTFLTSVALSGGGFGGVVVGGILWTVAVFAGLVIALEGVIVLIERSVSSALDNG